MINSKKLKERMKDLGITQEQAAEALGIKQPTFSQKCSGSRSFKVQEIHALIHLLQIEDRDIVDFFFTER